MNDDMLSRSERNLRILFVGKAPLSYVGGAELSTHHLLAALAARGHTVAAFTLMKRRSILGIVDSAIVGVGGHAPMHVDTASGYSNMTSIRPLQVLPSVVKDFNPDVCVVTGTDPGYATATLERLANQPSVLYVRGEPSLPAVLAPHIDMVIANSDFMAGAVRDLGVEATFLPSVFPVATYGLEPTRDKVLFVNPVPKKGVEIALYLAEQRPDIPFAFNLSWRIKPRVLRQLRKRARRAGNIEIRKATPDPQRLYRDCRLLIVPSQCGDAWPRVVSEAQISGTPVIGGRIGGIPEAVGPGGIVVDPPDSKETWLAALSQTWDSDIRCNELAELARVHSRRIQISVGSVVGRFEELLGQAIEKHRACPQREAAPQREGAS